MSWYAIVFCLLVLVDIAFFVSGVLMYRIDRSATDSLSGALVVSFILTLLVAAAWFFDSFLMWKS